ncbi:MAG: hypothetical protein V8T10_00995 [Merdibacter sp.]
MRDHDLYRCAAEYAAPGGGKAAGLKEASPLCAVTHELPMEHVIVHAPYIINLATRSEAGNL